MRPILSIMIPTKNRYNYLKSLIKTILEFDSGYLELVIQDNSDNNMEIVEFIESLNNQIIKYYYTKKHLSIIENCDLGVKNCTGEYICFMGDDDAISSYIVSFVKYMKKNNIESAIFNRANFFWNDIVFKNLSRPNLTIPICTGKITRISVDQELKRCLNRAGYDIEKMPSLYIGIVKKSFLDNIFNQTGTYFPGPSPDVANATALCFEIKEHVYVDIPILIPGKSFPSTAGLGSRKAHRGELKSIPHLAEDVEQKWEKNIPKIWTAETIWFESAIKAIRAMGRDEYLDKFNYASFAARFICFNYKYRKMIYSYMSGNPFLILKTLVYIFRITSLRMYLFPVNRIKKKLKIKPKKSIIYQDIDTSYEVSKVVDLYIESNIKNWNIELTKI